MSDRLAAAYSGFDALNKQDPILEDTEDGPCPRDYLYGVRMTEMLVRLTPNPPEPLRLAVRAQHLCRHEVPRDTYPEGRAGYHRWRTGLRKHHSQKAAAVLRKVGYEDATIERVASLIEKRNLASDPDVQLLEDAACLVFVAHQLQAFAARHPDDKMMTILTKTMKKMSQRGLAMAAELPLASEARALLVRALEVHQRSTSANVEPMKGDA